MKKLMVFLMASVTSASLMACAVMTHDQLSEPVYAPSTMLMAYAPMGVNGAMVDAVEQPESITIATTEIDCLHKNIYWEARNQPLEGMIAVAIVTLNRVKAEGYPSSICEVVYQAERNDEGKIVLNRCQFSWYCDGLSDEPNLKDEAERKAWRKARDVAEGVLLGYYKSDKMGDDALYYHADYVMPSWASSKVVVARISSHIFYKNGG